MTSVTFTLTDSVTGESTSRTEMFSILTPLLLGIPDPVVDSGDTSWAKITTAIGTIRCERRYYTPGQGVPAGVTPRANVKRMVVSIRPDVADVLAGNLDTQLTTLFSQARPGDLWTVWHEGEAHVDTPADYIATLARCYSLFKAVAPPSARFGQINMSFTASGFSSHGPLRKWISCPANGGPVLDFLGIDMYPAASADQSWATCMNAVLADVTQVLPNPRIEITESNDSAGFLGTDAQQKQFFADGWTWAIQNGCSVFVAYYGNSPSVWPPGPETIAELAAINSTSI